jgi:hypothetical protein
MPKPKKAALNLDLPDSVGPYDPEKGLSLEGKVTKVFPGLSDRDEKKLLSELMVELDNDANAYVPFDWEETDLAQAEDLKSEAADQAEDDDEADDQDEDDDDEDDDEEDDDADEESDDDEEDDDDEDDDESDDDDDQDDEVVDADDDPDSKKPEVKKDSTYGGIAEYLKSHDSEKFNDDKVAEEFRGLPRRKVVKNKVRK